MSYGQYDHLIGYSMSYGRGLAQFMSTGVRFPSDTDYLVDYFNRTSNLVNHLPVLKSEGAITNLEIQEIMNLYSFLELRRHELSDHIGQVVVVYNQELFFGDDYLMLFSK